MNIQYLEQTNMLNFQSPSIQALINSRKWNELNEFDRIKAVYEFVQNEIPLGFNKSDLQNARQVLDDGYGQCNTKATLMMALLRGVNIPCRLHGFDVSKDFQRGAATGFIWALAPKRIVHTWVEVSYAGSWVAMEGVITDKKFFEAVKKLYPDVTGEFKRYAIAVTNFSSCSIDWNGEDTFVQSAAIVQDYGIFQSPDVFFAAHGQHWGKIKNFMYSHFGRKIMTKNIAAIRNGHYTKRPY